MKLKKILAAIAACAMSAAMISMTVSAAGIDSEDDEIADEFDEGGDELDGGDEEGDYEAPDDGADDQGTDAAQAAPNPTTGNSPIALAVIPVALAAAAVVAKKAK